MATPGSVEPCSSHTNRDVVQSAISAQLDRGLFSSAEWLSDLVMTAQGVAAEWLDQTAQRFPNYEASATDKHNTLLNKARALFGLQQYQRCCFVLCDSSLDVVGSTHSKSPLASFYILYSHFLDGERAKERGLESAGGDHSQAFAGIGATSVGGALGNEDPGIIPAAEVQTLFRRNPHLCTLRAALESALSSASTDDADALSEVACSNHRPLPEADPYLLWLYGVVLRHLGAKEEAISAQLEALKREPLLRASWEELLPLVSSEDQIAQVLSVLHQAVVPFPFVARAWAAQMYQELQQHTSALEEFDALLQHFPTSAFLKGRKAKCLHERKDVDAAKALYAAVHRLDPYRLELMDDYSNVLFVLNAKLELAQLAIDCQSTDVYRAETNCVLGNYYGLTRRHELSLQHFRRAVAVDPLCVSAWTLMGHEYVEVKNTNAAIEAYRAAVAVDERDYRAWYGLGQVYELLGMYHFALHYYWRTTIVRPNDSRMWAAVAGCLEKEKRHLEALQCLERAEASEPPNSSYYANLVRRIAEGYVNLSTSTPFGAFSAPLAHPTSLFPPPRFENHASSAAAHVATHSHLAQMRFSQATTSVRTPSAAVNRQDKAAKYFEKLLAMDQTVSGDVTPALLFLSTHYIEASKTLLQVPNRAPSFDPEDHTRASYHDEARPSLDLRKRHATQHLEFAEAYLERLEGLMGGNAREVVARRKDLEFAQLYLRD